MRVASARGQARSLNFPKREEDFPIFIEWILMMINGYNQKQNKPVSGTFSSNSCIYYVYLSLLSSVSYPQFYVKPKMTSRYALHIFHVYICVFMLYYAMYFIWLYILIYDSSSYSSHNIAQRVQCSAQSRLFHHFPPAQAELSPFFAQKALFSNFPPDLSTYLRHYNPTASSAIFAKNNCPSRVKSWNSNYCL